MRTIKWLKEQIQNLPDDAEIVIDKEEIYVHSETAIHVITAWTEAADLSPDSLESIEIDIRDAGQSRKLPWVVIDENGSIAPQ